MSILPTLTTVAAPADGGRGLLLVALHYRRLTSITDANLVPYSGITHGAAAFPGD